MEMSISDKEKKVINQRIDTGHIHELCNPLISCVILKSKHIFEIGT